MGSRQWDHVRYTQPGPWFKAEIYAYRANHGQFNTVWGRSDAGDGPLSWFLNLKPLMPGEEQRRISKTYISAFLEATLHDRREYIPLFQDWRVARGWLPDTLYVNRYQDSSYVPLAGFQEDADITTTTAPGGRIAGENLSIWREGRIPWRQGDRDYNGVFLGWNRAKGAPAASYAITLPEGAAAKWQLGAASAVELSVASLDEDAPLPGKKKDEDKKSDESKKKDRESPDFTIELESRRWRHRAGAREPLRRGPAAAEGKVHQARSDGRSGVRKRLGAGFPDRARSPGVVSERERFQAVRPAQTEHGAAEVRPDSYERHLYQWGGIRSKMKTRRVWTSPG